VESKASFELTKDERQFIDESGKAKPATRFASELPFRELVSESKYQCVRPYFSRCCARRCGLLVYGQRNKLRGIEPIGERPLLPLPRSMHMDPLVSALLLAETEDYSPSGPEGISQWTSPLNRTRREL